MIGKKLGRYEILAKLGAGGMGEVYRARDLSLGRDVALKLLPEHVRDDPDRLRRFEHEARAASALNHPNIVTIYDIGQSDATPYIAMELVEGHTLRSLLTLRPFLTKRALALAAQAAEGLARAHGVGIIHRDLKPENLMVTRDGFVKILDFGLAKLHEPDPLLASDAPTEPATRPGVLMGTVGYMSPEQARGRPVDFRSDQFSCGSILYEMATGKRAFERETPVQTLAAIIESDPEPIQNLNPDVPPPFRWIVERCLRKNPEERYASTLDLARELRNVHDRLAEVSSGPRSLPPIRFGRGSWFRPATLAAFLGVAVAGVAIWGPQPPLSQQSLIQSVAVLPIKNLGGGPSDDLLTIAIADAVMTRLAEIPSLTVVDRSTVREHRSTADDPVKAARDMGAGFVVTGGVQRVDGRIAVSVRLVRSDSSVAWAQQYEVDPTELFALQKQIAQGLSNALKVRLTPAEKERIERAPTLNADAYADYLQGRAFLERPDVAGNVDRAIEIFKRAILRDAAFGLAHAGLGEAYWEKYLATKQPEWTSKASASILEAVRLDPEQAQVRISLAIVYQGTGRLDAAIEELRRALALQPRNDYAHRLLGDALGAKGLTDQAVAEMQIAVRERPAYWRNHHALSTLLARIGRYGEAISVARRMTELQPDNSRGFQALGFAHGKSGNYAEAIESYKRALDLAPDARAYTNLGAIYYDQGLLAEAVKAWEAGVKLEPTPIKHRNLGDAYTKLGETSKAHSAYQEAIRLSEELLQVNPQDFRTLSTLAVVEAKLGQRRDADRHIEQALGLNPKDGETLYRRAVIYALAGRAGEAVVALEKALANGFSRAQASGDEDLTAIRNRPDYKRLFGSKS